MKRADAGERPWCIKDRGPMHFDGFHTRGARKVRRFRCPECRTRLWSHSVARLPQFLTHRRGITGRSTNRFSFVSCLPCRAPCYIKGRRERPTGERVYYLSCSVCRTSIKTGSQSDTTRKPSPTNPSCVKCRALCYIARSHNGKPRFKCLTCRIDFAGYTLTRGKGTKRARPKIEAYLLEIVREATRGTPALLREEVEQELALMILRDRKTIMNLGEAVKVCTKRVRCTEQSQFKHVFIDHGEDGTRAAAVRASLVA